MNYEQFFKENYGKVRYFIYKMVLNWHDAEDLTQDTFLKFFKIDKTNKEMNGSINYLYECARNSVIDYTRKRSRVYRDNKAYMNELEIEPIEEPVLNMEDKTNISRILKLVYEEIEKINASQTKEIIKRAYINGENYRGIAKAMGLKYQTVTNLRLYGMKKLREKFGSLQI